MTRISRFRFGTALFLLCALALSSAAQDWKANPQVLVRKAIENENKQESEKRYFMYRDVKQKKNASMETREMIQTPEAVLARLVAVDGKPLTDEQRQKEDGRLNRLINSPDELAKKKKEQKEDDERARQLVGAIPDAFNFEYVGTEPSSSGELVVLKFSPNSNWNAPNRELQIFTGMAGTMKIAVPQNRLALMQAQLVKSVDFGWGILGRLDKGGDFMIQQSQVLGDHWDLTHMKLHFTGKVLLFKSLNIQEEESTTDYRPVPVMSVSQALGRLKLADTEYAKNANSGTGK
jgi:hypothetical protein